MSLLNNFIVICADCGCPPEECKRSLSPRSCKFCKLDECCCWYESHKE